MKRFSKANLKTRRKVVKRLFWEQQNVELLAYSLAIV